MATEEQGAATNNETPLQTGDKPRSLAISERGIRTGADFANVMSALMGD